MTTPETEVVDGELVPYEPALPSTLFGSDPQFALQRMSEIATALIGVVRDRKLSVRIQGREHLTAEAWTCLGGLVGITPVVTWTRPLEDGSGWEARVEARTLDGRVVGAAESMCTRAESKWARRDEFQLRSMSQTRAIGRALRAPLSPIAVLANYEPAASEEFNETTESPPAAPAEPQGRIPAEVRPTHEQIARLGELLAELTEREPLTDWKVRMRELAGVPGHKLTRAGAASLIGRLEEETETPPAA